jgi:hypothetical protein
MIWSWIISQVLMIIYIRFASWHHAPGVNAMREYVPTPNPYENPFHFWSWFQAAIVALSLSLGLISYQPLSWCIVMGVLCAVWYWLLFDPMLNLGTGKSWDYLGSGSTMDRWLKRRFGNNAGEYKAIIMLLLIILINVLKFTL